MSKCDGECDCRVPFLNPCVVNGNGKDKPLAMVRSSREGPDGVTVTLECSADNAETIRALFADFFSGRTVNETRKAEPEPAALFGVEGFDWGDPNGGTLHAVINGVSIPVKMDRETSDAVFEAWGGRGKDAEPESQPRHGRWLLEREESINEWVRPLIPPAMWVSLHEVWPTGDVLAALNFPKPRCNPGDWRDCHMSAFRIPYRWIRDDANEMYRALAAWVQECMEPRKPMEVFP